MHCSAAADAVDIASPAKSQDRVRPPPPLPSPSMHPLSRPCPPVIQTAAPPVTPLISSRTPSHRSPRRAPVTPHPQALNCMLPKPCRLDRAHPPRAKCSQRCRLRLPRA